MSLDYSREKMTENSTEIATKLPAASNPSRPPPPPRPPLPTGPLPSSNVVLTIQSAGQSSVIVATPKQATVDKESVAPLTSQPVEAERKTIAPSSLMPKEASQQVARAKIDMLAQIKAKRKSNE